MIWQEIVENGPKKIVGSLYRGMRSGNALMFGTDSASSRNAFIASYCPSLFNDFQVSTRAVEDPYGPNESYFSTRPTLYIK